MEDFCRCCGKTVNTESCINIFSSKGRRLLHCVRTIANCWVENVAGFPIYCCQDCQLLLKKVNSFRKRCTKIEAFLNKRKVKLGSNNEEISMVGKISDPLRIEEPDLMGLHIKMEPTVNHSLGDVEHFPEQADIDQLSERFYEDPADSDSYPDLSFDAAAPVAQSAPETELELKPEPKPEPDAISKQRQAKSRKYTMRVGKRTMYIKLTDDKQPKRIVDRERQWASARPCICEHCGRQFKDGSNLNVHLLRHTGTKNYECKECNEKCYTLHLLRRHQLKHTEGPYECTFCGLQYSTNSSRMRHERVACKKGRAPQSKTELIKKGERTFHCDVCDLWFLRAGNLTQHMNSTNHLTNARRKSKKFQLNSARKAYNVDIEDAGGNVKLSSGADANGIQY